jgi:hypothetical protein|tara:strand:- start:206 stop:382 length:177 start_codon:yes stop_codon:yes gene_type:complete
MENEQVRTGNSPGSGYGSSAGKKGGRYKGAQFGGDSSPNLMTFACKKNCKRGGGPLKR